MRNRSNRFRRTCTIAAVCMGLGVGVGPATASSIYDVSINTAGLAGSGSTLAFDFIAGGGAPNTLTITDFSTDGTLGSAGPNSGTVTGLLPGGVTLDDTNSFFNENLQGLTLGNKISFQLDASTNAPTGGALPDTFSFFVLNSTASASLVSTSDPTGSDSLLGLQIDGSSGGVLGNYSSLVTVTPASAVPVPEPGPFALLLSGLLGVASVIGAKRKALFKPRLRPMMDYCAGLFTVGR